MKTNLQEATASKKAQTMGGLRGKMIIPADRYQAIELVEQAIAAGSRQIKACEFLALVYAPSSVGENMD